MESALLYEEVQTFNKRLIELIFKVAIGIFLAVILIIVFAKIVVDKNVVVALTSTAFIFFLARFLLEKARLITQIRTDGIYVCFPPLKNSFYHL